MFELPKRGVGKKIEAFKPEHQKFSVANTPKPCGNRFRDSKL